MVKEVVMSKEIRIETVLIENAAREAGMTPEKFVSRIRSISLGREVCAHLVRIDGPESIYVCA
jgi:hypothetical protein